MALLFPVFHPLTPWLALAAMVFQLLQATLRAAALMMMQAAWLLLDTPADLPGPHAITAARSATLRQATRPSE